ncbi:formin FRM1, partial [Cardiosporidium cionae]
KPEAIICPPDKKMKDWSFILTKNRETNSSSDERAISSKQRLFQSSGMHQNPPPSLPMPFPTIKNRTKCNENDTHINSIMASVVNTKIENSTPKFVHISEIKSSSTTTTKGKKILVKKLKATVPATKDAAKKAVSEVITKASLGKIPKSSNEENLEGMLSIAKENVIKEKSKAQTKTLSTANAPQSAPSSPLIRAEYETKKPSPESPKKQVGTSIIAKTDTPTQLSLPKRKNEAGLTPPERIEKAPSPPSTSEKMPSTTAKVSPTIAKTSPRIEGPKVSLEDLRRIKGIKSAKTEITGKGSVPIVQLLDANGQTVIELPWQLDLSLLSVAQSSISLALAKKLGLLAHKPAMADADDLHQHLLQAGLGLGGGGFGAGFGTGGFGTGGFGTGGLSSGLGLFSIPDHLKQVQVRRHLRSIPQNDPQIDKSEGFTRNKMNFTTSFLFCYALLKAEIGKEKKVEPEKKEAPKKEEVKKFEKKSKAPKGPPKAGKGLAKEKAAKKIGKAVKDEGKTKRFFWDPLFDEETVGTIFKMSSPAKLELGYVEEAFAKLAPSKKVESKRPKVVQLLPDSKRAYNMNIALAKFNNYTFQELREAIIDINPKILSVDATETLLNFVPTAEETNALKAYLDSGGDLSVVDRPEQFVAAMMGVPLMLQRLDAHLFALQFRELYESSFSPLEKVCEACDAIADCNNFSVLLFAVLDFGNKLNEGDTQRGNAQGFKPSTLSKLVDIKTTTKPIRTAIQYICDVIWEQKPELLQVLEHLKAFEQAQRVDLSHVEGNIQKLKQGNSKIRVTCQAATRANESAGIMHDTDPFPDIMEDFVEEIESKIVSLEEYFKEVHKMLADQNSYYSSFIRVVTSLMDRHNKAVKIYSALWASKTKMLRR